MTLTELRGQKVKVYRNLHKNCLSVVFEGKVVAHVDSISLYLADFRVQPAGRRKVLETKQKNVHAFIHGTVVSDISDRQGEEVFYNPYKVSKFTFKDNLNETVYQAEYVSVTTKRIIVS